MNFWSTLTETIRADPKPPYTRAKEVSNHEYPNSILTPGAVFSAEAVSAQ